MERISLKVFLLILGTTVGVSRCEPPAPGNQYGVPGNFGGGGGGGGGGNHGGGSTEVTNSYGAPLNGGHDAHQDYIDSQPKSYEFDYAVKDAVSGNDFGRRETSDGETVRGEYRVQLPDGRTQIVTYTADWRTGFHADVRYEGVASYPDQYNANNNNRNNNNNNNNHNGNGYNTIGSGYSDLDANTGFGSGGYNAVGTTGIDNGYNANGYGHQALNNNGNYNTGSINGGSSNGNDYNSVNSVADQNSGYNYDGYSSNTFGIKSPIPSYGTPAFH